MTNNTINTLAIGRWYRVRVWIKDDDGCDDYTREDWVQALSAEDARAKSTEHGVLDLYAHEIKDFGAEVGISRERVVDITDAMSGLYVVPAGSDYLADASGCELWADRISHTLVPFGELVNTPSEGACPNCAWTAAKGVLLSAHRAGGLVLDLDAGKIVRAGVWDLEGFSPVDWIIER